MRKIFLLSLVLFSAFTMSVFAEGFDTYKKNFVGQDILKQIPNLKKKEDKKNFELVETNNEPDNNPASGGQMAYSFGYVISGDFNDEKVINNGYRVITRYLITESSTRNNMKTSFDECIQNIGLKAKENCEGFAVRQGLTNAYYVTSNIKTNTTRNGSIYTTLVYGDYKCYVK